MSGYTRRQLKEDKFAETAQGAAHWATGHRLVLAWVIGLAVVVVLATAGIVAWRGRQSEQANLELSAAMRTFNAQLRAPGTPAGENGPSFTSMAERGTAAAKEFQAIADKYSSVKPGKIAGYMQGVALIQTGDNAAAERQLKAAADSGDKDVAALAKMALASIYRASNRVSDAAAIYNDLKQHPTSSVSKAQALLELAEMYEKTDPQQAASIYQQLQKENPQSAAAQVASQKLAKSRQN